MDDWYEPLPIFVYGTLRRGRRNHPTHCADAESVMPAWTRGSLYHLPYGYPALCPDGDDRVRGDLVTFPDPAAALQRLDALEGFRPGAPSETYERRVVAARPLDADEPEEVRAWTYVWPRDRLERVPGEVRRVPDGDWSG